MFAESYQRAQKRIVDLMVGKDVGITVPASPDWSAHDVVRHLSGVSVDLANGVVDGFASDAWTAKQVSDRAEMSIEDVIVEWDGVVDETAALLDNVEALELSDPMPSAFGMLPVKALGPIAIGDILQHEFDLRNAYGDRSGRDLMDIHFAAAGHARSVRVNFSTQNLATIRIESTDSGMGWDVGFEEPVATVSASSFEILRAIGGRRTRAEMAAMGWDADPTLFLSAMVLPHRTMRETSLGE